ncbi:hypothetical protein RFM68_17715 [Mesorhizobium sp. MSK_1335]|uniref:Uncharacterized protein n=1 Tax=Mesorhizobium montanum TaxID=3072323 RepID=A0ABU4ZLV6_9HYPH|nr:hypothetical protein [Mesorhizobium sp. MSK_1335]MDX8526340.1 hypothetical protein [Mesorhizobium sp. MSK_1335]
MPTKSAARPKSDTARRQRGVQRKVDATDRNEPKPKSPGAMQAGARRYPRRKTFRSSAPRRR